MTLTSDKSTEAYRNWWPGPDDAMLRFMNRSIDLLEELDTRPATTALRLNRRGYLYVTGDPATSPSVPADGRTGRRVGRGRAARPRRGTHDPDLHCPATPKIGAASPTAPTSCSTRR
jgi:sarcosine oxidase subunit beta